MKINLDKYMNKELFFFPVRHHSLLSSKFLKKAINVFKPEVILIEGPSDANHLIENIAKSKMPVSIYGNVDNKEIKIGINFPFFDTSPEYLAIVYGVEKGIETKFIDLPVYDIDTVREKKINFEYSNFILELVKKSGLESFDEYYEKYFEIALSDKNLEDYMGQILTYCSITRELTPSNSYNDLREAYMASNIRDYKGRKTLVITGGFHSVVLPSLISDEIDIDIDNQVSKELTQNNKNYLIPYNVQNISSLNGYGAGIYYPYYYKILLKNALNPRDTFVELLTKYSRNKKKQIPLPKIISAVDLAYGLASLRDKKSPGVYELFDGAISAFTEFNQYFDISGILDDFKKYLIGNEYGQVNDMSNLPPIVEDFQFQIEKYNFTKANTTYTLNLLDNRNAYRRSVFLNKLLYLEIDFAVKIKGIDLFDIDIDNSMAQIYKISSKELIMPSIIEVAFLGESIDMAVQSKLKLEIRKADSLSSAVSSLKVCAVLQIDSNIDEIIGKIRYMIVEENNIFEMARAFEDVSKMAYYYETFGSEHSLKLDNLVNELYIKLMILFQNLEEMTIEDEGKLSSSLNDIYSFVSRSINDSIDKSLFEESLIVLSSKRWTTSLKGISLSILYVLGLINEKELILEINNNFVLSERKIEGTILFLKYLLLNNYQLLLNNNKFLIILNDFISDIDTDNFLKILPDLRKTFTRLRPTETIRLSKNIRELNDISKNPLVKFDISEEDFIRNSKVEELCIKELKQRGIFYE